MRTRICPNCFSTFVPRNGHQKYCDDCRDYRREEIEQDMKRRRRAQAARKRQEAISDMCEEIEEYNREHGTRLSYGKYDGLKRTGRLKK